MLCFTHHENLRCEHELQLGMLHQLELGVILGCYINWNLGCYNINIHLCYNIIYNLGCYNINSHLCCNINHNLGCYIYLGCLSALDVPRLQNQPAVEFGQIAPSCPAQPAVKHLRLHSTPWGLLWCDRERMVSSVQYKTVARISSREGQKNQNFSF